MADKIYPGKVISTVKTKDGRIESRICDDTVRGIQIVRYLEIDLPCLKLSNKKSK